MKTSNAFKETIKTYLDKCAAEDELFAETYKKENKSLDECCNYIMQCAKEGGAQGYTDPEVFGWAVHYYDEDDIKNIKPISGKVIVNHAVELTEEDKALAKQKAIELLVEESKEEAKKNLSETIKLSDEEISEAKKIAIDKVVLEQKEKLIKKKSSKKEDTKTSENVDLFSEL